MEWKKSVRITQIKLHNIETAVEKQNKVHLGNMSKFNGGSDRTGISKSVVQNWHLSVMRARNSK
jgi:hypothetical protein